MVARRLPLCAFVPLLQLALVAQSQTSPATPPDVTLVKRALAAELSSAGDSQHPMRYRLHKTSPRLSTTKEIYETKDGAVARLVEVNEKPLSAIEAQKEQARLDSLLGDPSRQRHRKQAENDDLARVTKVLRALPTAFTYRYLGSDVGPAGKVEKFAFDPNPDFDPPDMETEVLTAMAGELWIDASQERVARLEGHLIRDVDFGWGILGRLNKDGRILIEQGDVSNHEWRIVHFQMSMSGRILLKTKNFETAEEESQFAPVPVGVGYAQAIRILKNSSKAVEEAGR